jgi:4-amino-4-deoxy-L-arabinose transferase-like glycosyltransferase
MTAWDLWLWRLDASDLTFDEASIYIVAHRSLLGILDYLRVAVREHPPVYYLLIHAWMALAGTSEFSLRFFSVCAGLVALVLAGWLARLACKNMECLADTPSVEIVAELRYFSVAAEAGQVE